MESDKCMFCDKVTNNTTNRLVRDSCGHLKCRTCLLNDDIKCSLCEQVNSEKSNSIPDNHNSIDIDTPTDLGDDLPETVNEEKSEECERSCVIRVFENVKELDEVLYVCSVCDKTFSKNSLLQNHLNVHTGNKKFSCKKCKSSYYVKSKLNQHIINVHSGKKLFPCESCDANFNNSYSLKKHNFIHLGIKPFHCITCDKTFRDSSNFKKHQLKHLGVKYPCTLCDKKYKTRWSLVVHMQSHNEDKPFSCDKCDLTFYTKKLRDRHMLVHSGLKQFQCKKCTLSFKRKDNLDRHCRNVHSSPEKEPSSVFSNEDKISDMDIDSNSKSNDEVTNQNESDISLTKIIEENNKRQSVILQHKPSKDTKKNIDIIDITDDSDVVPSKSTKKTLNVSEMYKQMFPSRTKTSTTVTNDNNLKNSDYVHKKVNYYSVKKYANPWSYPEDSDKSLIPRRETPKNKYSQESIELYKKILIPSYKNPESAKISHYSNINSKNYREEWDKFKKTHCLPTNITLDVPPLAPLSVDKKIVESRRSESPVLNDINTRLSLPKLLPLESMPKENKSEKESLRHSSDIHWRRRMANQADSMHLT